MNSKIVMFLLAAVFICEASPAFAYLDPGTGSMILQGLIGGIAAGSAVIAIYFQKIKSFFSRGSSNSNDVKSGSEDD